MIVGKSLTALGSGGLKPEIIVTAQAAAALNLQYRGNSILPQAYQLRVEETQRAVTVRVSETPDVGEDTTKGAGAGVLVSAVAQYNVETAANTGTNA